MLRSKCRWLKAVRRRSGAVVVRPGTSAILGGSLSNVIQPREDGAVVAPAEGRSEAEPNGFSRICRPIGADQFRPVIPDHDLLGRIGAGSYGEVWLARNVLGQPRAVKVIYRNRFGDPRPFEREFEGIQRFEPVSRSHASQMAILHVGRSETGDCFYYVMELADDASPGANHLGGSAQRAGQSAEGLNGGDPRQATSHPSSNSSLDPSRTYTPHTLRHDLEAVGRLPAADCVRIGLSLTTALVHLHEQGLVHRDIKPSNVIFVTGVPKLGDIGLVTETGDTRSIVGTEGYIAPEGPGTPQADIFSLGKLIYEMSTGMDRRCFPKLPEDLLFWPERRAVAELNEVVLRACAKDPAQRYSSAEAMRKELEGLQRGGSVRRGRQRARARRVARRAAGWLAVAGTAAWISLGSHVRTPSAASRAEKSSTNEVANRLYRLGEAHFGVFRGTNMALAADYFQRAIQADTNFAQAYAHLAAVYSWGGFPEWNPDWEFVLRARELALQALALDGSLAEPHLVLAEYYILREWNWPQAEKEQRLAIALDPSSAVCHLCYAEFLKMVGRMPQTFEEINKARTLDPHSRIINNRMAYYFREAGQFSNALEQIDRVAAMEPDSDVSDFKRDIYCALGRFDKAIDAERQFRATAGEPRDVVERELGELKRAIEAGDPKAFWRREIEKAKQDPDGTRRIYVLACLYAQAGDTKAAFDCLDQALKERNVWLTFMVKTDWKLNSLRSDERFRAILREMHLE